MTDKEGCYVIVIGEIQNTHLTLVNIYLPNVDNPVFS